MARPSRNGAEPGQDVRGKLLAGAAEIFSTKGYAGTTVREIVQRAGVTKPVLYYYFRSKEGIYLALMREPFERFVALVDGTTAEEGTSRDRLVRLCLQAYDIFMEHLDLARVMYAIYYGPPQGAPFVDFDAYHLRFQDGVLRLLEDGIRRREFRKGDARDMMWAVVGAVNVAMELELCRPRQSVGRDGIRRMLGIIFDGIAPGKVGAKGKGKGR
jgi:AcrR family transcriptional regulator